MIQVTQNSRGHSHRSVRQCLCLCGIVGGLLFAVSCLLGAFPGHVTTTANRPPNGPRLLGASRSLPPSGFHSKNIEDLVIGDFVLAKDEKTGETTPKRVLRTFKNTSDHLRVLGIQTANGEIHELRTTNGHHFWAEDEGWIVAGDLELGDKLVQADGGTATIVESRCETYTRGIPIFNVEIEDFHTYFVATDTNDGESIFVHNASEHKKGKRPSTTGKHEKGTARKERDKHGGEKGDQRRKQINPPRGGPR